MKERKRRKRKERRKDGRGSCFCVCKQNQLCREKTWYFNTRKSISPGPNKTTINKRRTDNLSYHHCWCTQPLELACLDRTPCHYLVHSRRASPLSSHSRMAPHREWLPVSEGSSQCLQSLQWAHWWCAASSVWNLNCWGRKISFVTIMGWIFQKAEWNPKLKQDEGKG